MELRQLRHFLALVRHRHYVRASEEVGITQQALSTSIANFERELGVKLLERGRFGADTTDVGELLSKRVRLICAEIELLSAEAAALGQGHDGTVRIGVSSVIANRILPHTIVRFARSHPRVVVAVVQNPSELMYERLLAGELDFVISSPIANVEQFANLRHEPIGETLQVGANHLIMRAGHPLTEIAGVTLKEAREYPWLMPHSRSWFASRLLEAFRDLELRPPDYTLRTDSVMCAKSMVMQTDFVALLGRESCSFEIEAGLLSSVAVQGFPGSIPGYFSSRRSPLQPTAIALSKAFKATIKELGLQQIAARSLSN